MEAASKTRARTQAAGTLESFNPATGESVGSVPTITPDQVQGIVDEVAAVQPFWEELSIKDRARYLVRAADESAHCTAESRLLGFGGGRLRDLAPEG